MPTTYTALTVVSGTTIPATWGNAIRDSVITQAATYSALTTAITSPSEGMVAYLTDTDLFWFYKNAAWRLLPGQTLYSKRDTSTSFLTNQAAGSFLTAVTSASITVPSSGTGQAFDVEWTAPAASGAFTSGYFDSQLLIAVNGGAFTAVANSGILSVNTASVTYLHHGADTYKAGGTDTSVQLRINVKASGGNFDCIAAANAPLLLRMRSTGLLSSEVA